MAKNSNKTQVTDSDVRAFLSSVGDPKRRDDSFIILSMMEQVTGHSPKMWGTSIVGFDTYHYKYESGREGDFFKVGFSPRKQNLTVYIMTGFKRYAELMARLGKHSTGKSCLYIKRLEDVDMGVLKELITESYKFMVEKYD